MSAEQNVTVVPPRRRRRRWLRWALILGGIAVVLRVALGLLLPTIVDRIARSQGMTCTIGKLDLSLLGGSVELWDLELRPTAADADRLLRVEYATVDVDMSALFTATLRVHRVELDGVDADVARAADGRWSWDTASTASADEPVAAAPPPAAPDPAAPLEFGLPLEIRALRAQHVHVHVRDAASSPAFEAHLTLNAGVSDLGSPQRTARLELDAWSPEVLDALRIEGEGRSGGASLLADLRARVIGLRPGPLADYLRALGVQPVAESLHFDLQVHAQLEPTDDTATASRGEVTLAGVQLRADRSEAFALDTVTVPLTRVARDGVAVGEIAVHGVRGNAARTPAGTLRVAGLDLVGGTTPAADAPMPPQPTAAARPPFGLSLDAVLVDGVALAFDDGAIEPATTTTLFADQLALRAPGSADGTLAIALRAPGVFDRLTIEGACAPLRDAPAFDLQLAATGIAPQQLRPYLTAAGIESTFADGALRARLQGAFRTDGDHVRGDVALTDLELRDGDTRLATANARLQELDLDTHGLRAAHVEVRAAGLPVRSADTGAWQAFGMRVPDAGAPPDFGLDISEVSLEIDDLAVTDGAAAPIELRARVAIADAIDALTVTGTVTPGADRELTAALRLNGTGLTLAALKPLLAGAGLSPEWSAAEFSAAIDASVSEAGTEVDVHDVSFRDGAQQLLELERVKVTGLRSGAEGLRIAAIEVGGPTISAARDAQGSLTVAGVRLLPPPAATPTETAVPPPPVDTTAAATATTTSIDALDVTGASLRWRDDAVQPAVTATTLGLDVRGERLAFGAGVAPGSVAVELTVSGSVESLALRGDVRADPDDLGAEFELDGNGLRAGSLASYLPPNVRSTLAAGRLRASLTAQRTRLAGGGHDTRVEVSAVEFADGDAPLLSIERLALTAPRLDPEGGVFEIDEVAITGIAATVTRPDAESISALGFAFAAGPTPAPAPPTEPAVEPAAATATAATPPTVTLRKFEVDVADLTWHDAAGGAEPIHAGLRLTNAQTWRLLDGDPEALPPLELLLEGEAAPAIAGVRATVRAAPFAVDPHLTLDLLVSGIDAQGLLQAAPALGEHLAAGDLRQGVLHAGLDVGLHVRRRQPTDLGLDRPFGADVALTGLELRDEPDGKLLAGVEAINLEVAKITPATGDVHVKTLEVRRPAGLVRRLPDGLHALGFVVPPASTASNPPPATPVADSGPTEAVASKGADEAPAPELRIDELAINGLDFRYRDATVEPPFEAPLEALDVEVRGFTTRAFTESRPVRFRASLSSGKVPLPERQYSSLLGGLFGAAAKAIGGSSDSGKLEERRFFDEISTSGRLLFHPALEGRVRTSINSLELLGFRQLAEQGGVTIGDGVLDAGVELQLNGTEMTIDSRFVFQHLSVDEPADGPISRYLRLPAPLDTVLFVLRNDAGEQSIPLSLTLPETGVSGGQIAGAAATALGGLITDAIASSPFRIAGTLTDIAGLTGGPEAVRDDSVQLQFAPFETALEARERAELEAIVARMLDDDTVFVIVQHELGGGDIARGRRVANPDPPQTLALVQRLLARQAELRQEREQHAAYARVQLTLGDPEPYRQARADLEATERELGENELALDTALALLRPGADRRADKRARQTCLAMASDRIESVRRALLERGGEELAARIEVRKPRFVPATGDDGGRVLLTPKVRAQ